VNRKKGFLRMNDDSINYYKATGNFNVQEILPRVKIESSTIIEFTAVLYQPTASLQYNF
jgi:hypothetical protein